ncbi:endothelin-3 [Sceloporus undulatus]|uniref:endothelin-3 n=1 Tax=Sceloporus undulatus TaxID=8520 RepID=UPI001C4CF561|nr:endothelin-3 [Sceloporus undulatus]
MELGLHLLVGLTIFSSAGFLLPVSQALLPLSGNSSTRDSGLRSPGLRERVSKESQTTMAGEQLSVSKASVEKEADLGEAHRRPRRCTCYTYKDKECVYYCHLDIIWINTPQRTVPYGLANYRGSFRGKRSIEQHRKSLHSSKWPLLRCSCADRCDKPCMNFCTRTQGDHCNKEQLNSTGETEPYGEKEHVLT